MTTSRYAKPLKDEPTIHIISFFILNNGIVLAIYFAFIGKRTLLSPPNLIISPPSNTI